jgi:acetylornithine deacetylase/succinyl-diaminopimelate desuccinylase-like protein
MPGDLGKAMTAFAANPKDLAAAEVISADPMLVGQVRTTCVSTMVKGGHAPNALPQRAALNVNCRIFPGTPVEDVRKKLVELVGDPHAEIKAVGGWVAGDASPLRPDVLNAVTSAVHARYPGLAVVPGMSSGASDSVFYRAVGIPSYGVSSLFMKRSDSFAHGLNERVPVDAVPGALEQWRSVLLDLAK